MQGSGGLWRSGLHKGAMPYRAESIEGKGYYIFRQRVERASSSRVEQDIKWE